MSCALVALAGCSSQPTTDTEISNNRQEKHMEIGSKAGASKAITIDFQGLNTDINGTYQGYKITIYATNDSDTTQFDLCKPLAVDSSCLSKVFYEPASRNKKDIWVNYSVNVPVTIAKKHGTVLLNDYTISGRTLVNWGESVSWLIACKYGF